MPDVERYDPRGAVLEQAVGEARRSTRRRRGSPARPGRLPSSSSACASFSPPRETNRGGRSTLELDRFVELGARLVVPTNEPCHDERLSLAPRLGEAALDEQAVQALLHSTRVDACRDMTVWWSSMANESCCGRCRSPTSSLSLGSATSPGSRAGGRGSTRPFSSRWQAASPSRQPSRSPSTAGSSGWPNSPRSSTRSIDTPGSTSDSATEWQDRGLGTDAVRTLARYLVHELGHHRLVIDPAADNRRAVRCYEKAGFRPVGVMRRYERGSDGTFHDGLLMDLLASELT